MKLPSLALGLTAAATGQVADNGGPILPPPAEKARVEILEEAAPANNNLKPNIVDQDPFDPKSLLAKPKAEGNPFPPKPADLDPQEQLLGDIHPLSNKAKELSGAEIKAELKRIIAANDIKFTMPETNYITVKARAMFTAIAQAAGLNDNQISQLAINQRMTNENEFQQGVAKTAETISDAIINDITKPVQEETLDPVQKETSGPAQELQATMQELADLVGYQLAKDDRSFTEKLLGKHFPGRGFDNQGLAQATINAVAKAQGKEPINIISKLGRFPNDAYGLLGACTYVLAEYAGGFCFIPGQTATEQAQLPDGPAWVTDANDKAYLPALKADLQQVIDGVRKQLSPQEEEPAPDPERVAPPPPKDDEPTIRV